MGRIVRELSKGAVKGSQREKKGQSGQSVWSGNVPFAGRSGYRPARKRQEEPEDSPIFLENICCAGPDRDIMAQIRFDALRREGVGFYYRYCEDAFRDRSHPDTQSIRPYSTFRLRRCVHHLLNGPRGFIAADDMTYDLPRVSAYYRYDVDIFLGFCPRFILQKPYSSSSSTIFAPSAVSFFL